MSMWDKLWIKSMELGAKYGCHQRSDRSFFIAGYQCPVCARCTGMIIATVIAPILYFFLKIPIWVYSVMLFIMGIDGGFQYLGIKESTNIRRLVTGFIGGIGITSIKISIICALYKKLKLLRKYRAT